MPFDWRAMPYTSNHELNVDYFMQKIKEIFEEWSREYDAMTRLEQSLSDEIKNQVSEYVTAHPELLVTVPDHGVSRIKITDELLMETENDYVTPEMFGAVGDGETDDSEAWQTAIDTGKPVKALSKNYYIGTTLTTDKNINIDFNFCNIEFGDAAVLLAENEASATITGNNYNALDATYRLVNEYSNYSGFADFVGTNSYTDDVDNPKYLCGSVVHFSNGLLDTILPFNVTSPTITLYPEKRAFLKNIGNITGDGSDYRRGFQIKHYYNGKIENAISEENCYSMIDLYRCYNIQLINLSIRCVYYSASTHAYPIIINESSRFTFRNCFLKNRYWHALTTGGNTLSGIICLYNTVQDCTLVSDQHIAYEEHFNTFGTYIDNCIINSCGLCVGCRITNSQISGSEDDENCTLDLYASPLPGMSGYTVENVTFNCSSRNNEKIRLRLRTFNNNSNQYIDNVSIRGLRSVNTASLMYLFQVITASVTVGNIEIDGVNNFNLRFVPTDGSTYVLTNNNIIINNMLSGTIYGTITNLFVCDSRFYAVRCTATHLHMVNSKIESVTDCTGTTLMLDNIETLTTQQYKDIVNAFSRINCTNLRYQDGSVRGSYQFAKNISTAKYLFELAADGTLTPISTT